MLQSLFIEHFQWKASNFIKNRLQHSCFLVNIGKFLRIPFFTEHQHLLAAAAKIAFNSFLKYIFSHLSTSYLSYTISLESNTFVMELPCAQGTAINKMNRISIRYHIIHFIIDMVTSSVKLRFKFWHQDMIEKAF